MRTPLDFLGMAARGLECWEVECWKRPSTTYWSRLESICFSTRGFTLYGRDVTGAPPGGFVSWNGNNEQDTESSGSWKIHQRNSQSTSPRSAITAGVQPESCKSKVISRKWEGISPTSDKSCDVDRQSAAPKEPKVGEDGGVPEVVVPFASPRSLSARSCRLYTGTETPTASGDDLSPIWRSSLKTS